MDPKMLHCVYLAAHMTGNGIGSAGAATPTGEEDTYRASVAAALGAHDHRAGNPPRSLAEVAREVERILSPDQVPESGTVLGKIVAAWDKADSYSAAGVAVGKVLAAEGYAADDELTSAGRALAGLP